MPHSETMKRGAPLLGLLLAAGCVTPQTIFEATYLRPEFRAKHYTTVVVAPLSDDPALRQAFGEHMVEYLRTWTARTERGRDVLPRSVYDPHLTGRVDPNIDVDSIRKKFLEAGFGATLMVAYHAKEQAHGASHVWSEDPLGDYFKTHYAKPGDAAPPAEDQVLIETSLYDNETGKVVWSGHSRTVKTDDAVTLAQSYASAVIDELVKLNLIGKK